MASKADCIAKKIYRCIDSPCAGVTIYHIGDNNGADMKLETLKTPIIEVYVQKGDASITITRWGNIEGANIMVTGKYLALRMSCAMTWEEIAALQVALAAANS